MEELNSFLDDDVRVICNGKEILKTEKQNFDYLEFTSFTKLNFVSHEPIKRPSRKVRMQFWSINFFFHTNSTV